MAVNAKQFSHRWSGDLRHLECSSTEGWCEYHGWICEQRGGIKGNGEA